MKLGIIRCMQTEDYCPGSTDFKSILERTGAFAGIEEEIEIIAKDLGFWIIRIRKNLYVVGRRKIEIRQ